MTIFFITIILSDFILILFDSIFTCSLYHHALIILNNHQSINQNSLGWLVEPGGEPRYSWDLQFWYEAVVCNVSILCTLEKKQTSPAKNTIAFGVRPEAQWAWRQLTSSIHFLCAAFEENFPLESGSSGALQYEVGPCPWDIRSENPLPTFPKTDRSLLIAPCPWKNSPLA